MEVPLPKHQNWITDDELTALVVDSEADQSSASTLTRLGKQGLRSAKIAPSSPEYAFYCDLAIEAALEAVERVRGTIAIDRPTSLPSYIATAVRRTVSARLADEWRKRNCTKNTTINGDAPELAELDEARPDPRYPQLTALAGQFEVACFREFFSSLSEEDRALLVARGEGYSVGEISKRLGIPKRTVERRLAGLLARMQEYV